MAAICISKPCHKVADGYLHSLDVSQLPNGLYYIQLVGKQGTVTKELVVRR